MEVKYTYSRMNASTPPCVQRSNETPRLQGVLSLSAGFLIRVCTVEAHWMILVL